jgi:hypothetical protein
VPAFLTKVIGCDAPLKKGTGVVSQRKGSLQMTGCNAFSNGQRFAIIDEKMPDPVYFFQRIHKPSFLALLFWNLSEYLGIKI